MPVLDNPKHELYAQERAKGASKVEAYHRAGYADNDSNCARFEKGNEGIKERVDELLQDAAEKTGVTLEWINKEWLKLHEKAKSDDEKNISVKALENVGKHYGYNEKDNKQKASSILSEAELEVLARVGINVVIKEVKE